MTSFGAVCFWGCLNTITASYREDCPDGGWRQVTVDGGGLALRMWSK